MARSLPPSRTIRVPVTRITRGGRVRTSRFVTVRYRRR